MRALCLIALLASVAPAGAEPLILQLGPLAGARAAGYRAALAQGFYAARGLDVTIRTGGDPADALARGTADVAVEWMPAALVARERGLPMVNIAQPLAGAGMRIVCLRAAGIARVADLAGATIAVPEDTGYSMRAWLAAAGVPAGAVTMVDRGPGLAPLAGKRAACALTGTEEIAAVPAAGLDPADIVALAPEPPLLEDGLYALAPGLDDPATRDRLARFLAASAEGWDHARQHPDETARLLADADGTDPATARGALDVVLGRLSPGLRLDTAEAQRTAAAAAPLLSAPPRDAWTDALTAPPAAGAAPQVTAPEVR